MATPPPASRIAAAMRARRAAKGEGVEALMASTVAAGRGENRGRGIRTPSTRGDHHAHAIPASRRERPQGERALARLVDHVPHAGRRHRGEGNARRRDGRRRQLLRQRRGLRARPERGRDGRGDQGAEVAAPQLRRLDQVLLGPRARGQHRQPDGHPQPQVPDAGDRRLAQADAGSTSSTCLLPPLGPAHAARGDGLGDERHDHARQGALLGNERVEPRPTSAPPGRSPTSTICTSR